MYAFVAICLLGEVVISVSTESCPIVQRMENFDSSRFVGTWWEAEVNLPSDEADCSSMEFFADDWSEMTRVTFRKPDVITGDNATYKMTEREDWGEPGLMASFVLATDYTSYAVLYACSPIGAYPTYKQILTRNRHPGHQVLKVARQILEDNGLRTDIFFTVNQLRCELSGPSPAAIKLLKAQNSTDVVFKWLRQANDELKSLFPSNKTVVSK